MPPPPALRRVLALLALAVAAACAGAACSPAPGTPGAGTPSGGMPGYVKVVRAEEVDLWRGVNYQGLLLDVRNPDEWGDTSDLLPGATRIPLGDLEARLSEIAGARGRPTLVFDTNGPRGQAAAQILSREGFADVGWVDGGLQAYAVWLRSR